MATAQSVIKKFMTSLDYTSQQGIAAVDEAIRVASAGRFYSMRDVWNAFLRDANGLLGSNASEAKIRSFLKTYCDIDLTNNDTGAISGLDAGGSTTAKTAESVIPDTALPGKNPTVSYTIQGVLFYVDNLDSLTNNQIDMCKYVQYSWAENALQLISDSYGLRLDEAGAKVKEIHIRFTKPESVSQEVWDGWLACVHSDGSPSLQLCINMDKQELVTSQNDLNGIMKYKGKDSYEEYFDRTLTHELVHAVMDATIDNVGKLPASMKEGLAELIHGIDDSREGNIYHVLKAHNADEWWSNLLTPTSTYNSTSDDYHSDTYAAGYVFLRYMAKQLAKFANQAAATTYDKSGKTLNLTSSFTAGSVDLRNELAALQNVDARSASKAVNVYGDSGANVLYASNKGGTLRGLGGNDTIYGGNGKDTFYYVDGEGSDTIKNYGSGVDVVQVASGKVTTQISGYDLLLKVGRGSIRIVDGTLKNVLIKEGSKATRTIKGFKKLPAMASYNTNQTAVTLKSSAKGTFDARGYNTAIRTVDGRAASSSVNIYGNGAANTIRAGKKGGVLRGFGGNDTLYGGAGKDTFYYANGDGNDVINSYEFNKDIIQIGSGSISKKTTSGKDVILKVGKGTIKVVGAAGRKIVLKDAKGRTKTETVGVVPLPKGATYSANYTKLTLPASFSGTLDARDYRATLQTIDASKAKKAVTLYGNSKANRLVAGKGGSVLRGMGGNDTLVGGAGADKFYFGKGDGNITVENFNSAKDRIVLYDSKTFQYGGNSSAKTLWVANGKGKKITVRNVYREWVTVVGATGGSNKLQVWGGGLADSNKSLVTLNSNYSGEFNLATKGAGLKNVDARNSKYKTTLYGTSGNNEIWASKGGSNIYSFNGNDKIHCNNAGKDTIYLYRSESGNASIYNLQKNDVVYMYGVSNFENEVSLTMNTSKSILTLSFNNSNRQAQIMGWKKGQSLQLFYNNGYGTKSYNVNM